MKRLTIDRCRTHGYFAVAVDDEDGGGTRLTPTKCCGSWKTIHSWPLDKNLAEAMIEHAEIALEELGDDR